MKKMITIVSLILSIFVVSSCTNFSLKSDESSDSYYGDHATGPLISGTYKFKTRAELDDFYKIFKIKNPEMFVIPNFDDYEDIIYYFVSDGVDFKIIDNKIYDYDFPFPSFKIKTENYEIMLNDVSSFSDTFTLNDEISFAPYELHSGWSIIYVGENAIGKLIQKGVELTEDEIAAISNKFKEELKNVY